MKVTVNCRHIAEGMMGECTRCPIALSLNDMGYPNAWVDDDWVGLDGKLSQVRYPLPRVALDFIEMFDDNYVVGPFSFRLVRRILPIAIDLAGP